jgi:hypothetical protein
MVYHRRSWKALWILLTESKGPFWKLRDLVARNCGAQDRVPIIYTYSRRESRATLERRGFRVRNIEVDHSFPCHITDYVEDRYVFPCNARARVPRTRTAFRVALMLDG